jgi:hypothetical protein
MVHKPTIKDALVFGPLFVSSSLIVGLWTIVCFVVFNRWFVDHSLSLRLYSLVCGPLFFSRQTRFHKPKIKDEETNNGPQTKD